MKRGSMHPFIAGVGSFQRWWQESVNTLQASLVTPSAGLDIVQRQVFLWQRYQGLSPVGLRRIQVGGKVNNGAEVASFTWTCTQIQITLLPTSTEEFSIPPGLLFTKDQRMR